MALNLNLRPYNEIFAWDTQSGNIVASGKSAPVETKAVVFSPGIDG